MFRLLALPEAVEQAALAKKKFMRSEKGRIYNSYHCARRWAMTRCRTVPETGAEIKKIYARALKLRQWFDVVVDHIIPLSKDGLHCPGNLQIIYRHENDAKHNNENYKPQIVFL